MGSTKRKPSDKGIELDFSRVSSKHLLQFTTRDSREIIGAREELEKRLELNKEPKGAIGSDKRKPIEVKTSPQNTRGNSVRLFNKR